MGMWALILASLLYAIVAGDLAFKKQYALSVIFFCYFVANIGYLWIAYFEKGST